MFCRLGVIDAAECPPTYGIPHELVTGIMAGGGRTITLKNFNTVNLKLKPLSSTVIDTETGDVILK